MKKALKGFLVLSVLCSLFPQATMAQIYTTNAATSESYISSAGEKFVIGIANVATGFVELPKTMILTSQHEGLPYGLTVGLVTGVMHMIGRTLIGALDAVTFLIPVRPSVHPYYVWEDFSRETSYIY